MPISTSHWSWPDLTRCWSGCGSGRLATSTFARLLDLLLGAVIDEDRLAAPEHLDHLAFDDRRQIDLDRRTGRDGRGVRVHLRDQRPDRRGDADRADGACCDVEEIAACVLGRRCGCRAHSKAPVMPAPPLALRTDRMPLGTRTAANGVRPRWSPKRTSGTIRRRSIGTLAGGVQGWAGGRGPKVALIYR